MRTLFLDCSMGAAGDMLTASLLSLFPDPEAMIQKLNTFGIPGVTYALEQTDRCGIAGLMVHVTVHGEEEAPSEAVLSHHKDHMESHEHHHEHEHTHIHEHEHEHDHEHEHHHHHSHHALHDVQTVINQLHADPSVKTKALAVYDLLAAAESKAHHKPVTEIHFHEVGQLDAIADIMAVCELMTQLAPDEVIASPVCVGSGRVQCAHGILPVPTPATAYLLEGIPMYESTFPGELCTPTGAALLKYFVTKFDSMPVMKAEHIGYGLGQKEFPAANCLRAILGTREAEPASLYELTCQVDDMTGEAIAFAAEQLRENGALDVYTTAITMKKSRPGTAITVLCKDGDRKKLIHALFVHTSTLGVREYPFRRYEMDRFEDTVTVDGYTLRVKKASGFGTRKAKPEYEDAASLAREEGISFREASEKIEEALHKS
ncbi:MAG: nickel pincer cofactor biosynthesis protein LarC [Acidaminococcus sp.]|nr:nickel pincer cofactor biosynthesis protein LarC [Acidaminococcus sp.]MCI2114210.1 nickel pincer cofactor biosynthesis protein LarC [Acidaminococcus sp.]MCI2116145.1 nickel pincer cofactor biosynthesis protein LarC [Acidaminococcus sp.]